MPARFVSLVCLLVLSIQSSALGWSSKASKTYSGLRSLEFAFREFHEDNGRYPKTDTWWEELRDGGYVVPSQNTPPQDEWGQRIVYLQPGIHGDFDLYSCGSNEMDDQGLMDDISNWTGVNEGYHWKRTWTRGRMSIAIGIALAVGACLFRQRLPLHAALPIAGLVLSLGIALGCQWLMHPGIVPARNVPLFICSCIAVVGVVISIAWLIPVLRNGIARRH